MRSKAQAEALAFHASLRKAQMQIESLEKAVEQKVRLGTPPPRGSHCGGVSPHPRGSHCGGVAHSASSMLPVPRGERMKS